MLLAFFWKSWWNRKVLKTQKVKMRRFLSTNIPEKFHVYFLKCLNMYNTDTHTTLHINSLNTHFLLLSFLYVSALFEIKSIE